MRESIQVRCAIEGFCVYTAASRQEMCIRDRVVYLATDPETGLVESVRKNASIIASIFGLESRVEELMAGFDAATSSRPTRSCCSKEGAWPSRRRRASHARAFSSACESPINWSDEFDQSHLNS